MQTTNKGRPGADGATSKVVIVGNPGVGQLLTPCPAGLGGDDPFAKYLFSPDVIMSHQQAINFSDAQRTSLRALMLDAQKNFVPAQFKMAGRIKNLLTPQQQDLLTKLRAGE